MPIVINGTTFALSGDGKLGIPPGFMAGGANRYEARCFSRLSGKCHNDCNTEWTTNEHTIYLKSALVFSLALPAGKGWVRTDFGPG